MIMRWATSSLMASILYGQHLSKQLQILNVRRDPTLPRLKKQARKDIKRAFGVLQARFVIARGVARFSDTKTLEKDHDNLCDSAQHDH